MVALDTEAFAQHNGPSLAGQGGGGGRQRVPGHTVLQKGWPLGPRVQSLSDGWVLLFIASHKGHLHTVTKWGPEGREARSPELVQRAEAGVSSPKHAWRWPLQWAGLKS